MPDAANGPDIREYTPESRLRHPGVLWREMRRDLAASRELAWRLFLRNVRARYRQSALGYAWVLVPPVAGTLLFAFLRSSGVLSISDTGAPYVLFLVTGIVLWQTFSDAVQAPLRMVSQSREMLARVKFPREALILAGVGEVLLTFTVRCLLLVTVLAWYGHVPSTQAWLFPAGALALVLTGTAIGLVLVPAGILYQDVEQSLAMLLPFWMLLTPVLYPPPSNWPGTLTVSLNPVGPLLDSTRAWLLGGAAAHAGHLVVVLPAGILLLFCAWVVYHVAFPILAERMSS